MKYQLLLTLAFSTCLTALPQSKYQTIRITNDIELIKLSENAYVHVSYSNLPKYGRYPANGLVIINGTQALVFDSPWDDSLTATLFSWITDSMHLEVKGFVPNHWHEDCMGGLSFIKQQGIETYANQMTIDIAKSKNLPLPAHGFTDSLKLCLEDKTVECYYPGAAHTEDNIAVWIPSEQILFAGCMIKSVQTQNLGNTADGNLTEYPKTLEKLLRTFPKAKIVVPGHGPVGGLELIRHTKELADM